VLLVGEAPSPEAGPLDPPLLGRTGRAVAKFAGLTWPNGYAEFFDRANVLERCPAEGEPWPVTESFARGDVLAREACVGEAWTDEPGHLRDVVILGRRAALALGFGDRVSFFSSFKIGSIGEASPRFWLIPHPSSKNRLWNVLEVAERARRLLRDLVNSRRARGYPVKSTEQEL
jgi:uracil-DNA glycosylase